MWPSGTRTVSRTRRRDGQRGSSLITTIALTGILALLVLASLSFARSSTQSTARQGRAEIAIQVADAGVNRYISRLVEDPRYYEHYVDLAEDPRVAPNGTVVQPGSPWTAGVSWTYQAGGPKTWIELQDERYGKAAYSLRITPPAAGSDIVTVLSSARADRTSPQPVTRTIQSQIRPTSIADYQMISNATIKYGSTATTTGKLYSAVDINHQGVAKAPAYAAHWTCSSNNFACPSASVPPAVFTAGAYNATTVPSFRDQFPMPIDFGQFTSARLDVKDAAAAQGRAFNDPSASAWMIQFLADGRARVFRITGTSDPGASIATNGIGCPVVHTLPAGKAPAYFYFEQPVIVSDGGTKTDNCSPKGSGPRPSVVNGRVTIATKSNVYIGGNTTYAQPGDDVLGLIAGGEVIITAYTPRNLTWRAASLAQSGQWRTYYNTNVGDAHDSMLYIGSQTTFEGGYASMFDAREYQYDDTLKYMRPPLYPILEGSWETFYWREVLPPA